MSGIMMPSENVAYFCSSASSGSSSSCRIESGFIEVVSSASKPQLFAKYWYPNRPNQPIKGLVFICHGYGEHLDIYDEFGEMCAQQGLLAFGHDLFGHGRSDGQRGFIDDFDHYVDHIFLHAIQVKNRHRGLPVFIFGHCLGGLIAIRAIRRNTGFFCGMVLLGPLIDSFASRMTFWQRQKFKLYSYVLGSMDLISLDPEDVSTDPHAVDKLRIDPLRWNGPIQLGMAVKLFQAMKELEFHVSKIQMPFLILHSENDKICLVDGSKSFYKYADSLDKKLVLFPDAGRNLFLEKFDVKLQAISESITWMIKRCRQNP